MHIKEINHSLKKIFLSTNQEEIAIVNDRNSRREKKEAKGKNRKQKRESLENGGCWYLIGGPKKQQQRHELEDEQVRESRISQMRKMLGLYAAMRPQALGLIATSQHIREHATD